MRLIDADLLQETLAKEPMESRTYLRANEIAVDSPTALDLESANTEIKEWIRKYKNAKGCDVIEDTYFKGIARGFINSLEILETAMNRNDGG